MGIIMIARVYEGRKHVGYRLLDSVSKHAKDVSSESVISMLSRGGEIDNIELIGSELGCTYEDIAKYPSIIDGNVYGQSPLTLVEKVGYDTYLVCDWQGVIVNMEEQTIIAYADDYGLLNGKIVSIPLGDGFNTIIQKVSKFNVYYEDIVKRYRNEAKELRDTLMEKLDTINIKSDMLDLSYRVTDKFELELKETKVFNSESLKIPKCVERIGSEAFYGVQTLEMISGGDNLLELGNYAFRDCKSLKEVDLSKSKIREVPNQLFYGCLSLVEIKLPGSVVAIGRGALENSGITEAVVPECTRQILERAFSGCDRVTNIKWGNSLKYIGEQAFSGNKSLQYVEIPDGVETIGSKAFTGCTNLREIYIPESVTTLSGDFVLGCSRLEKVEMPKKLSRKAKFKLGAVTKVVTY